MSIEKKFFETASAGVEDMPLKNHCDPRGLSCENHTPISSELAQLSPLRFLKQKYSENMEMILRNR